MAAQARNHDGLRCVLGPSMPLVEVLVGLAILEAEVEGVEAFAFHREALRSEA